MLKYCLRIFLSLCLSTPAIANTLPKDAPRTISHVIYITFDGTRWQDIFNDHPHFQKFWQKYADRSLVYGAPGSHTAMEAASIPVSLPSYHSQMAGAVQPCDGNECGRIQIETFPEKILHSLKLDKKDVVTFSSWKSIALSVESMPETTLSNTGNMPMVDPLTHKPDTTMQLINHQQEMDHPDAGGIDRYDIYTLAQAMHYYKKYQPRFMWISLNDADESAHEHNLTKYNEALDLYDSALDSLFIMLKNLNLDKNTLVIVTTDHGRGNNKNWYSHGIELPESKQTWGFIVNGKLKPISRDQMTTYYSTLSIRPTIESALGIKA